MNKIQLPSDIAPNNFAIATIIPGVDGTLNKFVKHVCAPTAYAAFMRFFRHDVKNLVTVDVPNGTNYTVTRSLGIVHNVEVRSLKVATYTYEVRHHFDVWADDENGWQVNNGSWEGEVDVPESATDTDLLTILRLHMPQIMNAFELSDLTFTDMGGCIDIDLSGDGSPFLSLLLKSE